MLVNEYKPKYNTIEIIKCTDNEFIKYVGVVTWELAKHRYGKYKILHTMRFDETKSICMIISRVKGNK